MHTGVFAHKDFLHTRLCSCKIVNSFRAQFVCTQRYQRYVCEQRCIFLGRICVFDEKREGVKYSGGEGGGEI